MTRRARALLVAALLAASATGCGQQGPLVLPGDARPIERIDLPTGEAEQSDEERQDER
jgi:predicted small lipoprotein YifL